LKERTLGVAVFGREPDYDTSEDPIVRASAAEIRKKLAQFYQEPGHESAVHIEMLSGSYIAAFHFTEDARGCALPVRVDACEVESGGRRRPAPWRQLTLSCRSVLALPRWRPSDLDLLWGPLLKSSGPVLICVGQPAVYNLTIRRSAGRDSGADRPQTARQAPPCTARYREEDLVILRDRYVALDDAFCMVRIASLLERYHKPFTVRGERSTSFADLRDTPVVLIGAWDNPWTIRIAGQLRFTFIKDAVHDTGMVRDRQHPENTEWKLTGAWPNWDVPFDYAIVTRILDTTTDRPLIAAAGMTPVRHHRGGRVPQQRRILRRGRPPETPRNWQKKESPGGAARARGESHIGPSANPRLVRLVSRRALSFALRK
jgi:hypothetical protein